MEEGTVVAWMVDNGEEYVRGQTIAEIETDKTVVELPALSNGKMIEILAGAGTKVQVGGKLAKILETKAKTKATEAMPEEEGSKAGQASPPGLNAQPRTSAGSQGRPLASPNARRVARDLGVDLTTAEATGRRGRITAEDVRKASGSTARPKPPVKSGDGSEIAFYHWPARKQEGRPPLLLIHGLFGNAAAWNGVATNLSHTGTDVYAVDLPGHGNSSSSLTSVKEIAAAVLSTVRDNHDKPIRVAGLSLGAVVAAEIASLHNGCIELLLMCPAGLGKTANASFVDGMLAAAKNEDGDILGERLAEHGVRLGAKAIMRSVAEMSSNASQLEQIASKAFPQGLQAIDMSGLLAGLDVPVKALFALEDIVFPWQDAANLPQNVAAHFLAGAGHLPHMVAQDRVVEFLQS